MDEVDEIYFKYCSKLSGETAVEKIREVDFTSYGKEIYKLLKKIFTKKIPASQKTDMPFNAVYFEFDSCNEWDGCFFLNYEYVPLSESKKSEDGDEWAGEWSEKDEMKGPSVPDFDKLQIDENFTGETPEDTGAYIYAHARIFIEFCRIAREFEPPVPLCIGYHDQAVVIRVFPDSDFE